MERKSIDISDTRKVLIKAITNDQFLKEIRGFADPTLMEDNYSRLILTWCFEYYDQFEKAPKEMIKDIYAKKSAYVLTETDSKMIEEILSSISREFVSSNIEYYADMAEKYFNKLKIKRLIKDAEGFLDKGNIDKAVESVKHFKRVERRIPQGVDLLENSNIIDEALDEETDSLFRLGGDLGEILGDFCRGDVSAIIAPQKRGKTWFLLNVANYCMRLGLKVWVISLEMTKNQIVRRIYQDWFNKPLKDSIVEVPYFDDGNNIRMEFEEMEGLKSDEVNNLRKKMRNAYRTYLKVYNYPRNTFKVSDLKSMIDNSVLYEDDLPDVVIIDYADIMCPEKPYGELRHQLDQIWGDLAGLAVEYNIHILTASQANKQTFSRDIEQGDSAEANSKIGHISKYFALNQNNANKRQHVMRVAIMADRHKEFVSDKQVVVLQNLTCGKAMLDSRWIDNVNNLERDMGRDG